MRTVPTALTSAAAEGDAYADAGLADPLGVADGSEATAGHVVAIPAAVTTIAMPLRAIRVRSIVLATAVLCISRPPVLVDGRWTLRSGHTLMTPGPDRR
jgi:hypothetical protein